MPSALRIARCRGSGRVALRTCKVLPSARLNVAVTRWRPGERTTQRDPAGRPAASGAAFGQPFTNDLHELIGDHGDEQMTLGP